MIATIRGFVFLVFSCDCFSLYLSLFCFFRSFLPKWPPFCVSENKLPVNRNFKNLNFRKISTLLRSTLLLQRPLVVFFCPAGRLRCATMAEWHTKRLENNKILKILENFIFTQSIPKAIRTDQYSGFKNKSKDQCCKWKGINHDFACSEITLVLVQQIKMGTNLPPREPRAAVKDKNIFMAVPYHMRSKKSRKHLHQAFRVV